MSRGSGFHRVDRRKVHCYWPRPSRTARLSFHIEYIAWEVQERFTVGDYKVLGSTVRANAPAGKGNRHNPSAWVVRLLDLPVTATERDILKDIPDLNLPHSVQLGEANYLMNADFITNWVKSMFFQFGPLEWWGVSTSSKGKRVKAQARYFEESHARQAASSLDNTELIQETTRLTVRVATSAKFKVSTRVFDALRERIEAQKPDWKSNHLHFVVYPPHMGYRVLNLEGEDSGLMAQAKEALEGIVSGEVARKDGKDLWSTSFMGNGDGYQRAKKLEREHGVVIVRDRRKSQLRLFGPEAACKRVVAALEILTLEAISDNHVIELSPDEFRWACQGGFQALAFHLGTNKATFDIVSTPKRILISGSKADHATAIAIIARRTLDAGSAAPTTQTDCSVCWTKAEDPVRTTCDHVYCAGCFSDFCQAAGTAASAFRLTCVGAQGTCGRVLPLTELRDLLSSSAFEVVLSSSFASHIRRHPADFRYCPTPECGHVYRTTPDRGHIHLWSPIDPHNKSATFTCPRCLVSTCTSCHSPPHPHLSCAAQRDAVLAQAKKALGAQDCPGCGTAIEKVDGCNNVACGGCGTHLCWVCLKTFETNGGCYEHLNEVHGGAY
ncbi:hypothetical protein C8A05DRAFT_41841 [Staphylotrichum tortipilum]|uniref:RING-type domain-containing protein n=1 Tax=Staphylotrichum tortipilum TaxID=2831512 RepID=A0AAN6RWM2_9PEZI|nr:hypothetical protein C8A05DRAFT_41841 [Staphylotrichum longicolle]